MKKLIAILLTSVTLFACAVGLSGCGNKRKEIGYLACYEYEKYIEVVDLSEEGHKQKYIVMPETINGKPYQFTESNGFGTGTHSAKFSENNILEKIYFEFFDYIIEYNSYVFFNCKALKKTIFNNNLGYTKTIVFNDNKTIYVPNDGSLYTNYSNIPVFVDEDGNETKCFVVESTYYLANVEFIFNYDDAPNNGYYWIDDIDDGEKLELLPPDPTREGYIFGGWYCEKECENQFDFNSVINKPELTYLTTHKKEEYGQIVSSKSICAYPDNYVTYIYAKWR